MRAAGAADVAIRVFTHYYRLLESGQQGTIREDDIEPVGDLPHWTTGHRPRRCGPRGRAAVIKLYGGLGTSMGVTGPKSPCRSRTG